MFTYSKSPYSRTKLKINFCGFSSCRGLRSSSGASFVSSRMESKMSSPSSMRPPGSHSICMKNSGLRPSKVSSETTSSPCPIRAATRLFLQTTLAGSSPRSSTATERQNFSPSAWKVSRRRTNPSARNRTQRNRPRRRGRRVQAGRLPDARGRSHVESILGFRRDVRGAPNHPSVPVRRTVGR